MKRICVAAHFQPSEESNIGRMCWIGPDLWGVPLTTDVDGHTVRLSFPDAEATPAYNGRMGEADEPAIALSPTYFSAELDWELADDDPETERKSWDQAVETLRAGATRLTNAVRLLQPTSGLAGDTPKAFDLTASDWATGEDVKVPLALNRSPATVVGQPVVDRQMVDQALAGRVQIPEILLAQAAYWVRGTPDPKHGLAVVLLAMACETKVRNVLTDGAKPEVEPLVTALFKRPIFQQSAHELFGQIAYAVLGRSLRDDNRPVFTQVQKLFEARNQMAHRGAEPDRAGTWEFVRTAYDVFDWLRQFDPIAETQPPEFG